MQRKWRSWISWEKELLSTIKTIGEIFIWIQIYIFLCNFFLVISDQSQYDFHNYFSTTVNPQISILPQLSTPSNTHLFYGSKLKIIIIIVPSSLILRNPSLIPPFYGPVRRQEMIIQPFPSYIIGNLGSALCWYTAYVFVCRYQMLFCCTY